MKKITSLSWYGLVSLLFFALRLLPRRAVRGLGTWLGGLIYGLDKNHRILALKNLKSALGEELNETQREEVAHKAFRHFGMIFFDLIHLSSLKPQAINKHITSSGMKHLRTALDKGNGVLLFTAHYGSWEIAPSLVNQVAPTSVVARPLDNPYLEKKLQGLRQRFGSQVISKFEAARPILSTLRNNEIVAILIDQNVQEHEAVFVDFFGKKAATTPSLATFHLRTGAALIPVFCYPTSGSSYHFEARPPVDIPVTGNSQQDIINITQACTKVIEDLVRERPELWLWFHDRWKTRPTQPQTDGI